MVPEKKAAARRSGLRGHHSTWNAQLSAEGSYDEDTAPISKGREYVQRDSLSINNRQKNTSNARTSPTISEVCGFQHKARLSLPQDSNKSASCLHHDNESTPFSCPVRILMYQRQQEALRIVY